MPNLDLLSVRLTEKHFKTVSTMLYELCGISLPSGKEELVKSRLLKRLRSLGLDSFDRYLHLLETDRTGRELAMMVDALTTNKTSFFREIQHFDFLRSRVLPDLAARGGRCRIWSAGCSSGEEPFSLAIVLRELWPDIDRQDARILATDISRDMLERAQAAIYDEAALAEVPTLMRQKYFHQVHSGSSRSFCVNEEVRKLVKVARLNLIGEWSMKGPFDVIFCRNVMIYFDTATQQELVRRFWHMLNPGGFLFVGHSESLMTSGTEFHYAQPAVYVK
jgi:chemotaxis protein methyltransferase CheR